MKRQREGGVFNNNKKKLCFSSEFSREEQGDSKSTQLFFYLLYYRWVCEVSVSLQEETEWNLHILNRAKIIHYLEKSGPRGHGPSLALG